MSNVLIFLSYYCKGSLSKWFWLFLFIDEIHHLKGQSHFRWSTLDLFVSFSNICLHPFPIFFLINSLYYLFFIMKLIKVNFAKMYIIWIWFCFYSYLSFEYIKKINCDTFLIKFALHHTICNSSLCMTVSHLRDLTYYMFKNIFFLSVFEFNHERWKTCAFIA